MQQMTQEIDQINRNKAAVVMLRELGFPPKNIRLAMTKLTNIKHDDLAKAAETSRQTITLHLSSARGNPRVQRVISEVFGVPADLLFGDEIGHPADDQAA